MKNIYRSLSLFSLTFINLSLSRKDLVLTLVTKGTKSITKVRSADELIAFYVPLNCLSRARSSFMLVYWNYYLSFYPIVMQLR